MNIRYYILRFYILAVLIGINLVAFAQPGGGPPGGGGGTPPCWDPPCVPIDGGIGFLLAAGAFIGVTKLSRKKG